MKIGIASHLESTFGRSIKYKHTVRTDNKNVAVLSNEKLSIGEKVPLLTDEITGRKFTDVEIEDTVELYQEVDLDEPIDADRLDASMAGIPMLSRTLVDIILALQKK